ncbi:MAG: hypothetical protein GF398_05955, partial [Chitinivibrionales bacterium]|nr:hypothetical protein [Chitinivibrionales bacterium]
MTSIVNNDHALLGAKRWVYLIITGGSLTLSSCHTSVAPLSGLDSDARGVEYTSHSQNQAASKEQFGACLSEYNTTAEFSIEMPIGGEAFHQGEQCTAMVKSTNYVQVVLQLYIRAGEQGTQIVEQGLKLPADSMHVFHIPQFVSEYVWNDAKNDFDTLTYSTVDDSCYILGYNYGKPSERAFSDCYFSIISASDVGTASTRQ